MHDAPAFRGCFRLPGSPKASASQHHVRHCTPAAAAMTVKRVQGLCVNEFSGLQFEGDGGQRLRQAEVGTGEQVSGHTCTPCTLCSCLQPPDLYPAGHAAAQCPV